MAVREFRLPDLGEGLTEAEVLRWLVAVGDVVVVNQPVVEVETAKAAVEVPAPHAGVVTVLHVAEGETLDVGAPLISFDPGGSAGPAEERTETLVGYGPRTAGGRRRGRGPATWTDAPPAEPAPAVVPPPPAATPAQLHPVAAGGRSRALASPPVRKLARDLGVDLTEVPGSGPGGVVTRADLQAATRSVPETPTEAAPVAPPAAIPAAGDRIPVRGVRKATAEAMVASATIPQATVFVTADVTPAVLLRDRLAGLPEFAGVKVSPLLLVSRALVVAARRHPMVNSSWDGPAGEIVVHDRVDLGVAAATPRGLVVPVVRDAGALGLPALAAALQELTRTARDGRTPPADLRGATITVTNIGVLGVDAGVPLLNPGHAAILAAGAISDRPWVHEGAVAIRKVLTLALTFDHRIVDGQLGSAVLADVAAMLADPDLLLAWS